MTRDELHTRLVDVLERTFDIARERIHPEARLGEDLDIDSIDAVDLLVELKQITGVRLQPEAFKSVRTVGDVVDALVALLPP
ncbi:MAG: acyl carrier protein [Xanthomonadales bacterium]|nr:Acyl carrier protein [Xanthomonadales bacterium]MCC6591838.1 acyl carrier protein [Xanthomonadales bacterium]MCE7931430.1 acyl carrier protein [Xanthomonadales bacterium PRO6]